MNELIRSLNDKRYSLFMTIVHKLSSQVNLLSDEFAKFNDIIYTVLFDSFFSA
jgi:hypothetical protein